MSLAAAAVSIALAAAPPAPKEIKKEIEVAAPLEEVWRAWSTSEGAQTFFAPKANIELRLGGPFEILFQPDAPRGQRGAEELRVLSFLPGEMLSFEWNAPPHFPEVRKEKTFVVVQLASIGAGRTQVRLRHLGWREGGEWDKARAYFVEAWDVVLTRLRHRFEKGPIDWKNPPAPTR